MASRSKEDLNEILVDSYEKACAEYLSLYPTSPQPFLTCTYRSNDEQTALYAIGRTVQGRKVTNAQAGESAHNYKPAPAFDVAFITLSKKLSWDKINFIRFAEIIKKIQPLVVCGIDFHSLVDPPHFELKDWRKYVQMA